MVVLKLYLALVKPHLEYTSQVWSPYMLKDVQLLEKVQKFALRICSRMYQSEYEELLEFHPWKIIGYITFVISSAICVSMQPC